MKKLSVAILVPIFASILVATAVVSQAEQISLRLSRDWGYGGLNGDIQGLFSLHATGPADLARVEFFIDSTKIGEVTQPPFNLQFNTDNYSLGVHDFTAIGYSTGGQEYRSNDIKANFVPASQAGKVLIPILVIVFGAILISVMLPLVLSRRTNKLPLGAERHYGPGGGAICPKCQRPFALPLFGAHLGLSKLAICPHCGKLSLVRPESIEKLRQAEKAEVDKGKAEIPEEMEEEKLKKDLDNSKYQDF